MKRGLSCDGPKDTTWINQNTRFPPSPPSEHQLPKLTLPADLSLAAFESHICLAYTRKTLLRGGSIDVACNMVPFSNGIIDETANPGIALLRNAILSLAITFYGSQHRQLDIRNRGYQQYGQVLRQLNAHLALPRFQTSIETILTAFTCTILEIFLPTGPDNFLKHVRGLETILEASGPPESLDNDTLEIFHGLRLMSIVGGLAMSRPSLYSQKVWKDLPPAKIDEAGLLRHRIFDILADGTRLRYERDIAISTGSQSRLISLALETRLLLEKLEDARADWVAFNASELGESTPIVGMETRIANHASATVNMLYNTTLICLSEIMMSLEPSLAQKHGSVRNAAALKITKCLEFKLHAQREGAPESNTIAFVATKVAWQALGGFNSPEGRKLAKVVKSMVKDVSAQGAWA